MSYHYVGRRNRYSSAKKISQSEMDEIISKIDRGLNEFIRQGKYKDVLISMGNISKYSLNNQIYILMQMPSATSINGMKRWNTFGRHVIPGSKSIKIFSPILKYKERDMKDENGDFILDTNGDHIKERKKFIYGFEQVSVFDVSQTDGKPLDVFKFDEKKVVKNKNAILDSLKSIAKEHGYSISYASKKELGDGTYGLCNHLSHEIKILEDMSDLQEISTTIHECGHMLAHSVTRKDFEGLSFTEKREIKEIEAESIACIVCSYLGLDTRNFNFSYISSWADGDILKFRKNLDVISFYAQTIIKEIDKLMNVSQSI